MQRRLWLLAIAIAVLSTFVFAILAQTQQKKEPMTLHARGEFDVTLKPQQASDPASQIARMSIDKLFHGDLEGTSKGEMLTGSGTVKGSAGYVAMERVEGKLKGRSGSFVLQHNATMNRGVPQLNIIVVPDSGTGELEGLAGQMTIKITGGKHFYDFEYTLVEKVD